MRSALKKFFVYVFLFIAVFFAGRFSYEYGWLDEWLGSSTREFVQENGNNGSAEIISGNKGTSIFGSPILLEDVSKNTIYGGDPQGRSYGVVDNASFRIGYSKARKNPLWVAYKLGIGGKYENLEALDKYVADVRTFVEVSHDDYAGEDYVRAAMAPHFSITTRYGKEAHRQTFLTSNVCPQKNTLHSTVWQELEEVITVDYADMLKEVWVITGPIFDRDIQRLKSGVEIPDKFYKIVVDEKEGQLRSMAFVIDQEVTGKEHLRLFLTSIDNIEQLTGLDFFTELSDKTEDKFEKIKSSKLW